jgi:4-hydroxybenzoate polyprenyltransferase
MVPPEPPAEAAPSEPAASEPASGAAAAPAEPVASADGPSAPGPGLSAQSSARALFGSWRATLELSRPRSWPITALPFLVAAYDAGRTLSPAVILGTLYFLGPYNLLIHGSDVGQGRRRGKIAPPERVRQVRLAIALTNLPFLVVLVLLGGTAAGVALLLAVAAALAYSVPPVRTRVRPIPGAVTRAMHLVLPAACGSLVAGAAVAGLPWLALAALASWALATKMLRAIAQLARDRAARTTSVATVFGPRVTAVLSLVGYALAALLTVLIGRSGALAALGLTLYLLLPAMVLLAPRNGPAAVEAAARRASTSFVGLTYLVGFWLAVLLLRHWGLVGGFAGFEIAIVASAVAAAYAGWNIVAIRLATRRRRTHPDYERDILSLTIVVPCHDDGEQLAACLETMLDQTYADTSILVVDLGSTDGSAELAAEILGGAGRVMTAPPMPDDWTERSWARWTGVQASQGDLVLFVDADTVLVPVAARLLVEQLENAGWGLLSGVPRFDMPTAGERAAVPGFAMLLFGFRPIWLSALTGGRPPRVAFADGALTLVRRDAYEASGGHATMRDSLREDIDLARTFARAGRRVGTVHVADLAARRGYPGADAAVLAWRRMILPSTGGSLALTLLLMAAQVLAYVVPLVLPPLAIISGVEARTLVASAIPLFLLGFARFALVLTQRQPLTTVFWHPVTIGLALIGQAAGLVDLVTGRTPAATRQDPALAPLAAPEDRA